MGRVRTDAEMYLDLIDAVKREQEREGHAKISRVMTGANMSWNLLKRVFGDLSESGFLEYADADIDEKTRKVLCFTDEALAYRIVSSYRKRGLEGVTEMYDDLPECMRESMKYKQILL